MNTTSPSKRIAVVGGGISGVAAAHRLHELDPGLQIQLLEASARLGGVLETIRRDGFLIEGGADNFITNVPWATQLCRRIGFDQQLVATNEQHRQAFVIRRGRLCKIPEGFVIMAPSRVLPVLTTPILSPWGKMRLALEYFVPKAAENGDESLAAFAIRRFGRETYERLVQPLIGGIYTGDPERLSLRSTMPRFRELEDRYGSLIRGVWRQAADRRKQDQAASGGRYSMFVAPREGISSLIDALVSRLPAGTVKCHSPVRQLAPNGSGGWSLTIGDQPGETRDFDAVIIALPANAAAPLAESLDPELARELSHIPHASSAIVSLAYDRQQIAHPMDGFGFVVPMVERRQILSGSFSSVKYPGRAPEGQVLVRVYIGGATQPELAELDDAQLTAIASDELTQLLGIEGGPSLVHISRRPHAMPQYYVGHEERISRIQARAAQLPGLFFAGNAFQGVGIPFCIRNGEQAAQDVLAHVASAASPASGS